MRAFAQQHQACGFAVDAVDGREVGAAGLALEPNQKALLNVLARRCDGHEMGLVGHQQVFVFKHNGFMLRQVRLLREAAVVVQPLTARVGLAGHDRAGVFVQHLA